MIPILKVDSLMGILINDATSSLCLYLYIFKKTPNCSRCFLLFLTKSASGVDYLLPLKKNRKPLKERFSAKL